MTQKTRKSKRAQKLRTLAGKRYSSKCMIASRKFEKCLKDNPNLKFNEEFLNKHFAMPKTTVNKMLIDYQEFLDSQA